MLTLIEAPAPPKVEGVPQPKPKPKPKPKKVVEKSPLPNAIHIHIREESVSEPEPVAAAAPPLKGPKTGYHRCSLNRWTLVQGRNPLTCE